MISTLMSQRIIRQTADGPKELVWAHLISRIPCATFPPASYTDQPADALFAAGSTVVWDGGSLVLWEDQAADEDDNTPEEA